MSEPDIPAILAQLERIERSAVFEGSERLAAFLRFTVERTLEDSGASLKEVVIGNAIYTRQPPYDPRIDSTVRVEARRLRRKLKDYYATEGHADPVFIDLPTGGYQPVFTTKVPTLDPSSGPPSDNAQPIFEKGDGAAIAVLPFRALSRDPDVESFADGVTDELMFALERLKGARVLSRTTLYQQRSRIDAGNSAGAVELGVDAVVQGTVRREGERLRITVETSDHSGFIVFSDRIDVPVGNRLKAQEQVATTMLSRMRLDTSLMRDRQLRPGPVAVETMARIFRARRLLDRQTPACIREALAIFEEVSATASDYARGHAGVADANCDLFRLGLIGHEGALDVASRAAKRALEVDPHSGEGAAALATIAAWLEWDGATATRRYRAACERAEDARAARLYAVLLTRQQRHEEAARQFRAARAIEPFSVQQDVAEAFGHFQARRFDALKAFRAEAERETASPELVFHVVLGCVLGGEPAEASLFLENLASGAADYPDLVFSVAEVEALLGRPGRAKDAMRAEGGSHFARATLAAALDDEERCLDELDRAMERRELSVVWIRSDARFDRVRSTKRFADLTGRLDALGT